MLVTLINLFGELVTILKQARHTLPVESKLNMVSKRAGMIRFSFSLIPHFPFSLNGIVCDCAIPTLKKARKNMYR